jgi:hypothetical protein
MRNNLQKTAGPFSKLKKNLARPFALAKKIATIPLALVKKTAVSVYEDAKAAFSGLIADLGTLLQGEKLISKNGKYYATIQDDGNFVLYSTKKRNGNDFAIWSSRTMNKGVAPRRLIMQTDGNLVLYDKNGSVVWNSRTSLKGSGPFTLIMQDDGNLVIYEENGNYTWSTRTNGKS